MQIPRPTAPDRWAVGHIQPVSIVSYSNQTLREVVRLSAGGEYVRMSIANTFGSETTSGEFDAVIDLGVFR